MFARKTNKTKENEARSRSISNWININIYLSWRVAALSLLCVRWLLHACSSPFSCFNVFSPKRQWCVWNDGGKIRHIVKIPPWLCKLNFISTFSQKTKTRWETFLESPENPCRNLWKQQQWPRPKTHVILGCDGRSFAFYAAPTLRKRGRQKKRSQKIDPRHKFVSVL